MAGQSRQNFQVIIEDDPAEFADVSSSICQKYATKLGLALSI